MDIEEIKSKIKDTFLMVSPNLEKLNHNVCGLVVLKNNTMSHTKTLIFLLLVPIYSFPQDLIIQDVETGEPLPGVNVYSGSTGTTTDTNGVCSLDEFYDDDEITVSHIGYGKTKFKKSEIPDTLHLKISTIPISGISVLSLKSKKQRRRFRKLERDVMKVYPYAVLVGRLLDEYSAILDSLGELSYFKGKREKKKVFRSIEDQLIEKYGNRVRRMTKHQGRILTRLIDREISLTSYKIIKDFRTGFTAGFWQLTARLFGHNLRSEYDPSKGEDRLIEHIIITLIHQEDHEPPDS